MAGSGGLDHDGLVCGLAELVPIALVSGTEASEVSALATSDVKVLIGVDSEMYTAFSPSAATVATNVFNRARNSFSSNFGQSVSSYLVLTSTSGSADTLTGMHGSSAGEWLFNWGSYANGRSDRLSFHMASLQSRSPEPTSGQDGRSYTAGRYNVIWTSSVAATLPSRPTGTSTSAYCWRTRWATTSRPPTATLTSTMCLPRRASAASTSPA